MLRILLAVATLALGFFLGVGYAGHGCSTATASGRSVGATVTCRSGSPVGLVDSTVHTITGWFSAPRAPH